MDRLALGNRALGCVVAKPWSDQHTMPGSLHGAVPSGVMPYSLCTAFAEFAEYVQIQAQYHDGTTERSQLAQSSCRTFQLANWLTVTAALKVCWDGQQQGGLIPFLFYSMSEQAK